MVEVAIKINLADVLWEVLQSAYRAGQAIEATDGNAYKAAAQIVADMSGDDELMLARALMNAVNQAKTELSEYLHYDVLPITGVSNKVDAKKFLGVLTANNELEEEKRQVIYVLEMPARFSSTSVAGIASGLHDFMVATVLASWYMHGNAGAVDTYRAKASEAMRNSLKALFRRERPTLNERITEKQ